MQSSDRDEAFAWQAATAIMVFVTIVTLALRILGQDPFTDVFDIFIVYLPTAILLGRILVRKRKGLRTNDGLSTSDQATSANMVA